MKTTQLSLLFAMLAAGGALTNAQECAPGTLGSYAGTSCRVGAVTYTFPANDYTFAGFGISPITAADVTVTPLTSGLSFSAPWVAPVNSAAVSVICFTVQSEAPGAIAASGVGSLGASYTGNGTFSVIYTVVSPGGLIGNAFLVYNSSNKLLKSVASFAPETYPLNVQLSVEVNGNNGEARADQVAATFVN